MTQIKANSQGPEAQGELCKCIKKAVKQKQIRRGMKAVQKFVNKGEKGILILAEDTLPIEVYIYYHIPVMCEDRNLPSAGAKRPTRVIMAKLGEEYQEGPKKCVEEVEAPPTPQ
uniref:Ribosomal protein eL8/eL30/eS12/Gadd45 domain-containing protein n=1 Tax=Oryctolagus cuniculus TaxID=9986 RepID=A0A5F9D2Z5_RABIT